MSAQKFSRVASAAEIEEGCMKCVSVGESEAVLARVGGTIHAFEAICTHQLAYLEEGELVGHEVFCPLHNGSFDIRTGAPVKRPAARALKIYAVKVDGDDVLLAEPVPPAD